jgi:hypothetical protein
MAAGASAERAIHLAIAGTGEASGAVNRASVYAAHDMNGSPSAHRGRATEESLTCQKPK